jgi:predicted nuclease with TOPRIM domain
MGRCAVLLLTAALLAGCGGGDDDSPSKERFVADANRICREGEAKIADVTREQRGRLREAVADRQAIADVLEATTAAYEPYFERLRALDAPSELEEGWTRFLDGVGEAFDLIPELADATRERDREKLAELTSKFSEIADETRPFAQQNGLSDCLPD